MDNCLLSELERTFKKCSDCLLHPDYIANLNKLNNIELSQELIDYLCDKATSKKTYLGNTIRSSSHSVTQSLCKSI